MTLCHRSMAAGSPGPTPLEVFDVFAASGRRAAAITHLGSVPAPNRALADIYVRRMFARRHEQQTLWLVPRVDDAHWSLERIRLRRAPCENTASSQLGDRES